MRWLGWCLFGFTLSAMAADRPLIFPAPQKMIALEKAFSVEEGVPILVPPSATPADLSLARELVAELSDRYGIALRIDRTATLPSRRFILMGTASNPLVSQYVSAHSSAAPAQMSEAYSLRIGPEAVVVVGNDEAGAFYGMQSVRQLVAKEGGHVHISGVEVDDWPHLPFRAIRLYLPGHENIAFFKRFLRDFMALYKFNKVVMEVNASMRLDRHPELNAGWIDFSKDLYYTQRYYPRGPHGTSQDSAHHDTADGEILEKDEVADLVSYANAQHIEVIPEIPTFTHSYYLLTRHKDLGLIPDAEWSDTYDPSKPEVYKLVFDVLDEYIEVMKPKMIHFGHDEMVFPLELCTACQTRDAALLYADDVRKIHDYLTAKGIKTAIYGDHLIESVRGVHQRPYKSRTGWEYNMPGALTPQQVKDLIPKDILIFNWFWQDVRAADGRGEPNDVKLVEFGLEQVHNNFMPNIQNYARRSVRPGVIGGVPSAWAATNEYTFGKDMMMDYLGTINLMWSTHWPEQDPLSKITQSLMPEIRRRLGSRAMPSEEGDPVQPIDIRRAINSPAAGTVAKDALGLDVNSLKAGALSEGARRFEVPAQGTVVVGVTGESKTALPAQSEAIPIAADVSSIVFLHASAKAANNDMSYRYIHNFPDTADLLGWYEVVYEDGFVDTVPIRFGWNILPVTWGKESDVIAKGSAKELSYAYAAAAVPCGDATLFSYEWVNPRFGKVVKEVRLHGSEGFRDTQSKLTPNNAIVVAAISVVRKRPVPPTDVTAERR
jgi:hypothetical protein